MAQISTANLKTLIDKIARYVAELDGLPLASAVATGSLYTVTVPNSGLLKANSDVLSALDTLVLTTIDDATLMALLYPAVRQLYVQNPVLNSVYAALLAKVLDALDAYGQANNTLTSADRGGLDAMLRVLNAGAPTLRAHEALSKYCGRLSPGNVFTNLPYVLGHVAITGATTGTYTPTGNNSDGKLDTSRFAPGQVALLNTKGEGLTSTTVALTILKNGVGGTVNWTVATTTDQQLTAGDDTSLAMTGCLAQTPAITGGNSGDTFDVVILPDRAISAV